MNISDWSSDVCSSYLVERQLPRDDFGNQAKCLQPVNTKIVEAGQLDPPVVHGANAAQHLAFRKVQDSLALLQKLPRFVFWEVARRVADHRCHPARRDLAPDDAFALVGLDRTSKRLN